MPSVLIAEDDPLTLSGISLLLAATDFKIVGAVTDGAELLDILPDLEPDILLLDVNMPNLGGIEVLSQIRCRGDHRPIVLITGAISGPRAVQALEAGANGVVIKTKAPDDLVPCLKSVLAGQSWFDHDVLHSTIASTLAAQAKDETGDALTARERQVAELVQSGLRNQEIAAELGLTVGTVKSHLHNIFTKLGIRDRAALILKFQRSSLGIRRV